MDTLVRRYSDSMNNFQFNSHADSALQEQIRGTGRRDSFGSGPFVGLSSGGDSPEERDNSDAILKYINQMLMEEEDLGHLPCMFHDCSALQATEKSFYDVLDEKYPPLDHQGSESPETNTSGSYSSHSSNNSAGVNNSLETNWIGDFGDSNSSFLNSSPASYPLEFFQKSSSPSNASSDVVNGLRDSFARTFQIIDSSSLTTLGVSSRNEMGIGTHSLQPENSSKYDMKLEKNTSDIVLELEGRGDAQSQNSSRRKKNHYREDSDFIENERSNKQPASYGEESEQTEIFDRVLLCATMNPHWNDESPSDESSESEAKNKLQQTEQSKGSNRGKRRGKKQNMNKEVVDLRSLLTQCAQAVASFDERTATELLKRIRQHSSPQGDGTERLAHYFADALEGRLSGTGTTLYTAFKARRITAADILKAYQVFISACPFKKISHMFANKSIRKVATGAKRLHIIDFGILYGFQWPCLIQGLSMSPEGPPRLRITGIEYPQPGRRPVERVEATGNRLANYCKRFNVPFTYNAIAKKWDTIKLEDLKIDRDEILVVNCLYRMENVPDETVVASSPRDAVLNLVKRINPDLFIHGVINGTYSAPFFVTRFREALFHFSAVFDLFEATVKLDSQERMLFEREILGRDAMNVLACEGTERIERPETYKQWQVRNLRAGFRQLPLDQGILNLLRNKVKSEYHKDFSVDEDNNWILQGWKGRLLFALSCWKPSTDNNALFC